MKILAMQATFGKLEGETITFRPGLNVIHAPNEWGKSTWCAFMSAMLYGIDSKDRSTLADKRRYAPWSGKAMTGRMDLEWNGRQITIERSTAGVRAFGKFSAYETQSGLPVPELTADNCGQVLLGVEKSVFEKTAFIRHSALPVTQDEALRRRLHALITTGDESETSDRLAKQLKDLKNKCRLNSSTGLLPAAEAKRDELSSRLQQLEELQSQISQLQARSLALQEELQALENHKVALAYEAAQADLQQLEKAKDSYRLALAAEQALSVACNELPDAEEAQAALEQLNQLQEQLNNLQHQETPSMPAPPAAKAPFLGLTAEQATAMVQSDIWRYQTLTSKKQFIPFWCIFAVGVATSVILAILPVSWWLLPALVGVLPLAIKNILHIEDRKKQAELEYKYASNNTAQWLEDANTYAQALENHAKISALYEENRIRQQQDREALERKVLSITQGAPISASRKYWEQVLRQHSDAEQAKIVSQQAQAHMQAMDSVVRHAPAPEKPDALTYSAVETETRLAEALAQQQHTQKLLAQIQGQAEALGHRDALTQELKETKIRIQRLEAVSSALILAQQTLEQAAAELQRQFAPRISRRATELLSKLTDGRYDRLTLDRELCPSAGTTDEDTLHTWHWCSDGTIDQVYLALRMAVAEELTPEAPLILDDALVLFDDQRLKQAMDILKETAIHRQVILFSCQNREKTHINT